VPTAAHVAAGVKSSQTGSRPTDPPSARWLLRYQHSAHRGRQTGGRVFDS